MLLRIHVHARLFLLAAILFAVLTAGPTSAGATAAHFWSKSFGASPGHDYAFDVAVDALGNVVVVGSFGGTINLGGSNLVSAGLDDAFVARYSANGTHIWSKRMGGTGQDEAHMVGVDGSGNVYVVGKFNGTANFGGSNITSMGQDDVFVALYQSVGTHLSSTNHGSTGSDRPGALYVDPSGTYVLAASFFGTGYFGLSLPLFSSGLLDIALVKFSSGGNWGSSYGGASQDYATGVGMDAAGNVYMTGRFQQTINLGGSNLSSAGAEDAFLAKYNTTGAHQWSQRFGASDWDASYSLAVDATGNSVITGYFLGAVNFGGGALPYAGNGDMFLAKYNTSGTHLWSRSGGGTGYEQGYAVSLDASGNVSVTGWFGGTANFGGSSLVSAGQDDVFLARYDASGSHLWSSRFGGDNFDQALSVANDATGETVLSGAYTSTTNYGGSTFTSVGGADFCVARYGANSAEPAIRSIVDVGNDQGRRVRIRLAASGFDSPNSTTPITAYEAYLRDDPLPAGVSNDAVATAPRDQLLIDGWEFVGSTPAGLENQYLLEALTDADSTITYGAHSSVFFIRAATATTVSFYDSPTGSGMSRDNLAPPAPESLSYMTSTLAWLESKASDFDYFSVYGSTSATFDATAVLLDQTTSTSAGVSGYPYYYVTATDFAGNEGAASKVSLSSGVGPEIVQKLAVNAYPNPFNPRTTVRYDVPERGRVTVTVYNTAGARVVTLVDRDVDPGSYSASWDGRDDRGGRAGSGIYFVRVQQGTNMTARKIALVK